MSNEFQSRRFNVEFVGQIAVIRLVDKKLVDDYYQYTFRNELFRLVTEFGWRKLLVNLANVQFMSSSHIDVLIRLQQRLHELDGKLVFCNILEDVLESLLRFKLDFCLTLVADPRLISIEEIIHETFGDPFKPIHFEEEWRTEPVLALARHMVDTRDFSAMPILGDALEEAGCDNPAILDHCRGNSPHVTGCWVIEPILGKMPLMWRKNTKH